MTYDQSFYWYKTSFWKAVCAPGIVVCLVYCDIQCPNCIISLHIGINVWVYIVISTHLPQSRKLEDQRPWSAPVMSVLGAQPASRQVGKVIVPDAQARAVWSDKAIHWMALSLAGTQ